MSIDNYRAVLLDIEGTTTPISFVHQVLFPYSRTHLESFLKQHSNSADVQLDLERLQQEHSADAVSGQQPPALIEQYVYWLIDHDRKSPALKSLQGKIWEEGYKDGSLCSIVFPDVPRAIERWHDLGISLNIFSSGSVLAQKLLFAHTDAGDLTSFIDKYFDTSAGKKNEVGSYETISAAIATRPNEICFVSDVVAELDAAAEAGMKTYLSIRPGNPEQKLGISHPSIRTFDEL